MAHVRCGLAAAVVLALSCQAIDPVTALDESTAQTYFFIDPDSAVIEILSDTVPDLSTTSFAATSESALHAMGLSTPSELEELAQEQGNWYEEESYGTWERWWFTVETGSGNLKWVQSGASSARTWYNPGRVYAATNLYRNDVKITGTAVKYGWWWKAKAVTLPVKWTSGETYLWTNKTEHWYGGDLIYHEKSIYW
jgi:hypothetical protein